MYSFKRGVSNRVNLNAVLCVLPAVCLLFLAALAASTAQAQWTTDQVCAALDMSSEDCTRITSISTIPHSDLMLPAASGLGDVSIAVDVSWLISTAATEGGTSLCSGAVGHSQTRCLVPGATLPAVPQSVFHCVPMARRDWIARLSQQTTGNWKIVLRHWDGATLRDWESM